MSFKKKLFFNTMWSIGGQFSCSLIQLIANIFFARYLSPVEYGQIGIIVFFVYISNVLIEGGLGGALVRKIDVKEIDFSTVFIFNLALSILLYFIIVVSADFIANFYGDSSLSAAIVVSSLVILFNSLNFVQNNRLIINLQFKKISLYRFFSVLLANIVGIVLLFLGYGIWAIISSLVFTPLFLSIILWYKEGGIGKIVFSITSFKSLFAFGINTTFSTLIDTFYNNIYQLILGRYFSLTEVGLFYQAKKLQDVPNSIVFGTTNTVLFSSLSKLQEDIYLFSKTYSKVISYFSLLIGLISLITISYSREILILLFGYEWQDSGFYLYILSISSFFYVHEMFNRIIFKTFNRTRVILVLEIFKKILLSLSIITGIFFKDIEILLYGFLLVSICAYIVNIIVSRTFLKSDYNEFLLTFKIVTSIVGSYLLSLFIKAYFDVNFSLVSLAILPITVSSYFLFIKLWGIELNFREAISLIHKNN